MTTPAARSSSASLSALAEGLPGPVRIHEPTEGAAVSVLLDDVTHDSREAGPGVLFACRPGAKVDGHEFASEAVAAGSPALLVERVLPVDAPQVVVASVAEALGHTAAHVHGHPARELRLVGITGTNGKTTSAYLVEAALQAAGARTGLLGTVQTLIDGEVVQGVRTTPEATDLQRLLRRMRERGVEAVAMEVSSHGLALGRMNGTVVDVALFTNLSQDHLDFHADLEDYFAAKASLFTPQRARLGVVNVDGSWGRRLAEQATVPVTTISAAGAAADVVARDVKASPGGSTFRVELDGHAVEVSTALPGPFNVANALGAVVGVTRAGVDIEAAVAGVAGLSGVPGRMERVEAGQQFTVLVDYAHTPDSLENVLRAARVLVEGRVIVVIGCGGDRDRGKRPQMGRAAVELADLAVLTSDNPRSEDPRAILREMEAGAAEVAGARWHVEPDRRAGIAAAIAEAAPGDLVLIAGKGHETSQELATRTVPFDDRAVARELLSGAQEDVR